MMKDDRKPVNDWVLIIGFIFIALFQAVCLIAVAAERDDLKTKYEEARAKYEALDKLLTIKLYPEETE